MAAIQADRLADVTRLRAEIGRMQRRTASVDVFPVSDALAPLFPAGGLRAGASYALPESPSLLFALMGPASRAGSWCAFVGMPDLSFEAAEGYGIDPQKLAFIPHPGDRWRQAVASTIEVFPLVAVRPPERATAAEASRLAARLRDRAGVLLVIGAWPGVDLTLSLGRPEWRGVDAGYGALSSRTVTITATGRQAPVARRARVLLPGPSGGVEQLDAASVEHARRFGHLTAIGA